MGWQLDRSSQPHATGRGSSRGGADRRSDGHRPTARERQFAEGSSFIRFFSRHQSLTRHLGAGASRLRTFYNCYHPPQSHLELSLTLPPFEACRRCPTVGRAGHLNRSDHPAERSLNIARQNALWRTNGECCNRIRWVPTIELVAGTSRRLRSRARSQQCATELFVHIYAARVIGFEPIDGQADDRTRSVYILV